MSDRAGQQFGNYRLVRLLGRGGFAEVYLGEHHRLKSQAAIKVLHTQLSEGDITTFLNEAQTISRLDHPNIIQVLDFDIAQGVPFLVMSYAPEGTLRHRHPKGSQLSPEIIVPYVKQIADALHYAHSLKLIHRDIKPENMLLGRRNQVLLSDFGLALIMQSSHYQSLLNTAGTVAYMAPEQIQGKPRPASDQYALGIVIYEWFSGNRPFQGSFTEVATQHITTPPPPLHDKIPGISPAIEQVVLKALAKDPYQRFATMQEFASAFEQACQPPLAVDPTPLLSQSPVPNNPPAPVNLPSLPVIRAAPVNQPLLTQNPGTPSTNPAQQSFTPTPFPNQHPRLYTPAHAPYMAREPASTIATPRKSRRQKWGISLWVVLATVIVLLLVGGGALWLLIGKPFSGGTQRPQTLTGSLISINATTRTLLIDVNGQTDTITNVPDTIIQALQPQVGKVYSFQVTQNSDSTFSMVAGTNPASASNGTQNGNQRTPTAIKPGSISFNGPVKSSSATSLVMSGPDGQTYMLAINASTDLSAYNGAPPAVGASVNMVAAANPDGSFTATLLQPAVPGDPDMNAIAYTGITTSAVGADRVIHFTSGTRAYVFLIPTTAVLTDFGGNAQAIGINTSVKVKIHFPDKTVVSIGMGP